MRKTLAGLALAVLALAGCSTPDDGRGDPGKVVDREHVMWSTRTKGVTTWYHDYDLDIRRPDGTTYGLDVTEDGYDHCYRGSSYPECVDR